MRLRRSLSAARWNILPRFGFWVLLAGSAVQTPALSVLAYNVAGNGTTNWSTNSAQVQAIGRQMAFLQPDIIAFNEIPFTNTWQMPNFVATYLPGYFLATNSGTDGFIRSVIASRYPIVRSKSWLDGGDLNPYGYTNANFTRDLFEAEINVPGATQHLHVFTTHLKALQDAASSGRRAAEASAISNFFVNGFLTTNAGRPYLLCGDLNEDITNPPGNSGFPVQRLVSPPTGLRLTTPTNPVTRQPFTYSIRSTLNTRLDYILPCAALATNVISSQVFRTDVLSPTPAGLMALDDKTASDHLPVLMVFNNPYDAPFRLTSFAITNATARLTWQSAAQRRYRVEASSNFTAWTSLASNLVASTTNLSWTGNVTGPIKFVRVRREP